jgi:hypothetical protein
MEADHIPRAGPFMQAVDVLGNERKVVRAPTPSRQDVVSRVRACRGHLLASPVVPFPHQHRVTGETLRNRKIFGSVDAPHTTGSSERGVPLAAEIPAPLITVIRWLGPSRCAISRTAGVPGGAVGTGPPG